MFKNLILNLNRSVNKGFAVRNKYKNRRLSRDIEFRKALEHPKNKGSDVVTTYSDNKKLFLF